ncbi:uncharacterized protein EDB93DRAFT_1248125 [Suillus bovinus]|uniref:uncharacterized protein n=1 Tax=Suillus bovinus TaxID=48563 RepID=UPI001B87F171|nr:uncharacterized protein EDB93DRAFT_1248125 [Suillus bovinus]KAG2155169.1 hypothetical protein EDB93DRAFT_1248125 [Suillus bovinus]
MTSHPPTSNTQSIPSDPGPKITVQLQGKDKTNIYAVLAQLIFADHPKYSSAYNQNPKKFANSVRNHIVGYKKLKARFSATGASILPGSIEHLAGKIGNIQSDIMSLHDSKHQHFLAKLGAKSENQRNTKKYTWLHETYDHEASQAIISHQREQENRAAEIHLHEVDIQVHEAHSAVLNKEAETLCLRIQYQQLLQASNSGT